MPTHVAIVTPASLRSPYGDSLRVLQYAQGLWEVGFRDFVLCSREPNPDLPYEQQAVAVRGPAGFVFAPRLGCRVLHAHQNAGLFLEGRIWVDMHGYAPLESRLNWLRRPLAPRAAGHLGLTFWATRRLTRKAEKILCAAPSIAANLRRHYPRVASVEVLPNSLRLEDFPPTAGREPVVGVVGGFTSRWGRPAFEMALRVAGRCPGVPFRFVGRLTEPQRRQAAPLRHVEILGAVGEADYRRFLREVTIALMPFPDWCAGGGSRQKLLQAAASAQAIVSTPAGLEGFEPPPDSALVGRSPVELAEQITALAQDESERRRRGEILRRHITAAHDLHAHAQRLAELYERAAR